MRPSYTKRHKKIKCVTKRLTPSYKTAQFGYSRRITSDMDNINQVLKIRRSKLARRCWKIMPKDSCEVYKIRRKRQIEKKKRDWEKKDCKSNKKDTTGQRCRCGHKQCVTSEWTDDFMNVLESKRHDDSSKSSYSSNSASETSYSLTDSDN